MPKGPTPNRENPERLTLNRPTANRLTLNRPTPNRVTQSRATHSRLTPKRIGRAPRRMRARAVTGDAKGVSENPVPIHGRRLSRPAPGSPCSRPRR